MLVLRGMLFLPLLAYGRTPFERLEEKHLQAVHDQRIEWMKKRAVLEPLGVYQDFRAVFTNESATRASLARSAKEADVQIVFADVEPGIEDHVLFLKPPAQDFKGVELPHRISPDDSEKWHKTARKQKQFMDEIFGAATEAPPEPLARWDQATSTQSVTGFATASVPDDGVSSRTIAFRNTTTHILAAQLTPEDVLESLKQGHVYVAHDWLCDSTGLRFYADNNIGVFEMGDEVGTGMIAGATKISALVSVPALLKLIRNGVTVMETTDTKLEYTVTGGGTYRLEAWLNVDGEARPWIFSNPLYIRKPWDIRMPSVATPLGVEVHRDITYSTGEPGDEGKHKLDLYIPTGRPHAPVLMFLHGGSWMTGDRSLYPALGIRLAKSGIAVAIPSYRLMPRNPHPAQMKDAAAAFDWVYRNVEKYGGDPKRIFVSGHSSGGHLAALLALDETYLKAYGLNPSDIRGVISMSGVYDVRYVPAFRVEGDRKDASPFYRVHSGAPPFLISYCQWDYLGLPMQAREFAAALKKAFVDTKLLYIPHDNHITEIINVAKDEGLLVNAILSFVE